MLLFGVTSTVGLADVALPVHRTPCFCSAVPPRRPTADGRRLRIDDLASGFDASVRHETSAAGCDFFLGILCVVVASCDEFLLLLGSEHQVQLARGANALAGR